MKCSTCRKIKESSKFIKSENKFFKSCSDCRAYQTRNYKLNSQKILQARANKYNCKCGSVISHGNLTNHLRSKKHKRYLDNKDKPPNEKYYYKFWDSKIDGVTYYHQSKKRTKMIKCYCGQRFYPSQVDYDKHIMSENHLYFIDIIAHSRRYEDDPEYVIYEKYNF